MPIFSEEMSSNCPLELSGKFRFGGLTGRFLIILGTLVLAGSIALLSVLQWLERRQGEQAFLQQATINADFLSHMSFPDREVLAGYLGTLTGWKVYFKSGSMPWVGAPGSPPFQSQHKLGVVEVMEGGGRRVVLPVAAQNSAPRLLAAFVLPPDAFGTTVAGPGALVTLGAFLLVALTVAYWLARSLIQPLRSFAATLPKIDSDAELVLPAATRNDELGHVARTFLATRRQLQEERGRRAQAERLATLGRMAASLAHEVRNPVSAIRMHAELITEDSSLARNNETLESLGHIKRESDKIENLVQQWSFFARPEPPRTQTDDLRKVIQQVVSLLAPSAMRSRLSVEAILPTHPIFADFDGIRISQALTNMLQNAIHASPEGGTISVRAEIKDSMAVISVIDSGPGFSAEALQKFAEPFFSEKEGGMGLGLTVASEVASAHSGTLRVINHPGDGACVTLQIPVSVQSSPIQSQPKDKHDDSHRIDH